MNQVADLSKDFFHKSDFVSWLKGKKPTVGVLIQFLYEREYISIECEERDSPLMGWRVNKKYGVELCDVLLEEVKDVLKNNRF